MKHAACRTVEEKELMQKKIRMKTSSQLKKIFVWREGPEPKSILARR